MLLWECSGPLRHLHSCWLTVDLAKDRLNQALCWHAWPDGGISLTAKKGRFLSSQPKSALSFQAHIILTDFSALSARGFAQATKRFI